MNAQDFQETLDKMDDQEYLLFTEKRDEAARNMDFQWARDNGMQGMPDETIEIALHKMRYELTNMPPELRHESAKWLRKNGYKRFTGEELLTEGELP